MTAAHPATSRGTPRSGQNVLLVVPRRHVDNEGPLLDAGALIPHIILYQFQLSKSTEKEREEGI